MSIESGDEVVADNYRIYDSIFAWTAADLGLDFNKIDDYVNANVSNEVMPAISASTAGTEADSALTGALEPTEPDVVADDGPDTIGRPYKETTPQRLATRLTGVTENFRDSLVSRKARLVMTAGTMVLAASALFMAAHAESTADSAAPSPLAASSQGGHPMMDTMHLGSYTGIHQSELAAYKDPLMPDPQTKRLAHHAPAEATALTAVQPALAAAKPAPLTMRSARRGDDKISNPTMEYAFARLKREGHISPEAAAGILGNVVEEDPTLDPQVVQHHGHDKLRRSPKPVAGRGYGLVQWTTRGRQNGLVKYAGDHKLGSGTLDAQLGFILCELQSKPYASALRAATAKGVGARAAAVIIMNKYEAPKERKNNANRRGGNAEKILKAMPKVA